MHVFASSNTLKQAICFQAAISVTEESTCYTTETVQLQTSKRVFVIIFYHQVPFSSVEF